MHYTYIIYSKKFDVYYKGYTTNLEARLEYHNTNKSRYTKNKGPWALVYSAEWETKTQALIEEKRLKRLNRKSILKLIVG